MDFVAPPGVRHLRSMSRSDVLADLLAGLVITAFLLPVGMGYSQASGLPPVYGLYATVVPLLVYAVLGPSRILVLGPDSSLAPLIAATIVPLAAGDPDRAVALAGALSIGAGLVALAAGIGKFGFVTELLSMPVRIGYLNGIAVVVIIGQLPKLLGISVESDMPVGEFVDLVAALGDIERTTASVGVASLLGLVAVRVVAPKLPRSLVVVIGSIVAVEALDLGGDLALVGSLPSGFPVPAIPRIGWGDFSELAAGSLTIAVVSFADTSVLSRAYAKRLDADVDPNAEFIGLGAANVVAGFFQGSRCQPARRARRSPSRRGEDLTDGRLCRTHDRAALGRCAGLLASPRLRPRGHRDPGRHRLGRCPHGVLACSLATQRVLAVDDRVRRRRGCRCGVGHRRRRRRVALGVRLPGLATPCHHAGPYRRRERLSRHRPTSRRSTGRWPAVVPFRSAAVLRQRRRFPSRDPRASGETPDVQWVVVTAEPITSIDATAQAVIHELHDDLAEQGIELGIRRAEGRCAGSDRAWWNHCVDRPRPSLPYGR
ncbi:MAG: SulP family inorganic anion transporter [Acidimicrobiales bacterium]